MDKITVTINVTQEDIDQGTPASGYFCPIARAVRRVYPFAPVVVDFVRIFVVPGFGGADARWNDSPALLPYEAQEFVRVFDKCKEGEAAPFSFTAELPAPREYVNTTGRPRWT